MALAAQFPSALTTDDPLLVDSEQLASLASDAVVQNGIAFFKDNRVLELGTEERRLWAEVEGPREGMPYIVEIDVVDGGAADACETPGLPAVGLRTHCTCPFTAEPVCRHVIATLVAYAGRVRDVRAETAAEQAIADCQHRAQTEVRVEHRSGNRTFGTWAAWTVGDGSQVRRRYTVHVRSTTERINACSCPDFAVNRLGTCKHIEAVLHQLRRKKVRAVAPPVAVVHAAWDRPGAADASSEPRVALWRAPGLSDTTAARLHRHFDGAGRLRAELPDAWAALEAEVGTAPDVHLGDDARALVLRLAADRARAARAGEIRAAITRTGGHLSGVKARLYPYQTEGVAFLASTGRAILADDMGLGKTLQAIAAARWLIDHGGVARVLVICPASLKTQWAREVARFTGLDTQVVDGGAAPRVAQYRRRATFTMVSYEVVLRDLEVLTAELAPDLLILDEAQRIKNWRTKTAAAIKAVHTRYAFVLTGTPLENRLEDLYSVMQVVDGRVLGPLWHFLLHFHVTDERGKIVAYRNLSELRQRLAPVMLRRDKRIVRDQLPERTIQTVPLPLSPRQTELHDGALRAAARFAQIQKRRPLTPREEKELLAALQLARMACDAAGLVDKETVGSPKLDELARILEASCIDSGEKVVVFSQWEHMTRMADEVAKGLGLGTARLHGGVASKHRQALVDQFMASPDVQVFLSTDAGSTGLNLQVASIFVNLDLPWNPAVLEQRIARIHRLGQPSHVHVYLLVAEASYEERVGQLVQAKGELFRSVVTPDDGVEDLGEVIAVSRRMVDLAVEALEPTSALPPAPDAERPTDDDGAGPDGGPSADGSSEPPTAPHDELGLDTDDAAAEPPVPPSRGAVVHDDIGAALERTIIAVEAALAGQIETIVARKGGLIVIATHVDEALHRAAEALSSEVPVAVMDRRTWNALSRMGHFDLGSAPVPPAPEAPAAEPIEPPLVQLARRRLAAAEALTAQGMHGPALELVTGAMLARVAAAAGRDTVPELPGAAVWLFSEAVPRGFAPGTIANAILQAHGLAQVGVIPEALITAIFEPARGFVLA